MTLWFFIRVRSADALLWCGKARVQTDGSIKTSVRTWVLQQQHKLLGARLAMWDRQPVSASSCRVDATAVKSGSVGAGAGAASKRKPGRGREMGRNSQRQRRTGTGRVRVRCGCVRSRCAVIGGWGADRKIRAATSMLALETGGHRFNSSPMVDSNRGLGAHVTSTRTSTAGMHPGPAGLHRIAPRTAAHGQHAQRRRGAAAVTGAAMPPGTALQKNVVGSREERREGPLSASATLCC
jgi:hypothetical protein